MQFLVQFVRFRRGVPEVIRTTSLSARDAEAVPGTLGKMSGTANWPAMTEAIRVLDEGGNTLMQWRL
jgi:hypothetical protein